MDRLDTQINPIKKSLAFNSTVGFDSNLDDNESYEVYKALKYLLTPQVFLYKKDADTLIFVQYKGKAIKNLPNYRRVLQTGGDGQVIQLMVKTK